MHGDLEGKSGMSLKPIRDLLRVRAAGIRLDAELADQTPGVADRSGAEAALEQNREQLGELQHKLYADGRHGLLVVLQAMDTGGKDGTIRRVCTAFNPQGTSVTSFGAPTEAELRRDFLWRIHAAVPGRGHIGVFNRSHYEDVLVVRVKQLVPESVWRPRYDQINAFEATLEASGIHVVKIMLHIGKDEQRRRLQARLDEPHKRWKFDSADLATRERWDEYMAAFEEALAACTTPHAPWYVVPANRKWYRNYAVSQLLRETLEALPLEWPQPRFDPARVRID
jgi:PPK2 family polyphosphate:nucleotide phosphotransferase